MDSTSSEIPTAELSQRRETAAYVLRARSHAPAPFVWEVRQHYPPLLPASDGYPYLGTDNPEKTEDDAFRDFLIKIDLMLYAAGCGLCICLGAIMLL